MMRALSFLARTPLAWAVCAAAVLLANVPAVAAWLPYKDSFHTAIGKTLTAVHQIQAAERAGEDTVLVAGNSVVNALPPSGWYPRGTVAVAQLSGLDLFAQTALARYLIDVAAPDVLLVSLSWPSFVHVHTGPFPQTDEWVPHPSDAGIRRFGYGYVGGAPRQLRQVLRLQLDGYLGWREPWVCRPAEPQAVESTAWEAIDDYWMCQLPKVYVSDRRRQRLRALRAYGAERGVRVLYYLSPQHPWFTSQWSTAWTELRASLAPELFMDLGDFLPADAFCAWPHGPGRSTPDLHHYSPEAGRVVARVLGEQLAAQEWPELPRPKRSVGLIARLRYVVTDTLAGSAHGKAVLVRGSSAQDPVGSPSAVAVEPSGRGGPDVANAVQGVRGNEHLLADGGTPRGAGDLHLDLPLDGQQ